MRALFERVFPRQSSATPEPARPEPTTRRSFICRCGRPVFFRNSRCLACQTPLGYEPDLGEMLGLAPAGEAGTWRAVGPAAHLATVTYVRCANFENAAGCNWLLPATQPATASNTLTTPLCRACRLNRTIPDLTDPQNGIWWGRIEVAKRRLVSTLIALGLPVASKVEDPQRGLAFDLLRPAPGRPVLTGHDDGIVTLNIEEADDARRERTRERMNEPYRTLLGHLRHEVGHYYWDRLVDGGPWLPGFRTLFGDEREDYATALKRHYAEGPRPQWQTTFVSAYATSHPWEDWAESWAHYLHMVDTIDTAASFGLDRGNVDFAYEPFVASSLYRDEEGDLPPSLPASTPPPFLPFVNAWIELTAVMNELARSMGQPDLYPFVLSSPAVMKLHFIHLVIHDADRAH
jgi:hypothetical protein